MHLDTHSVRAHVRMLMLPLLPAAAAAFAARFVPGAVHMNVNSQVQIRQLLFPDSCPTPTKKFKADNPAYNAAAKPRPPRWLDFELHGLWGPGQPGRLAAGARTETGLPAVRTEALWSMAGKPGAARKALELAASGTAASSAAADDRGPDGTLDESSDDALDEDEAAAAAVMLLPGAGLTAADLARLDAEAEELRVGKMYAAMGGGAAGLEACAALEQLIQVRAPGSTARCVCRPRGCMCCPACWQPCVPAMAHRPTHALLHHTRIGCRRAGLGH